jgi:hypothetical protein
MPAAAFAAMPSFAVVKGRKHHQALLVEVEIFSFNEPLIGIGGWLVIH